jgi:uncharacterized membrane protein
MLRKAIPAFTMFAVACSGGDRPAPAEAPPAPAPAPADAAPPAGTASTERVVYGLAVFSPTMSFRPCDGGAIVSLVDSTSNRLRPAIGLGGSTEELGLFVIGVGATSPRRELILRQVDYAVRPAPGEGCERPAPDYTVGIRGLDSAWQVLIRPRGIEHWNPAGNEAIRFPAAAPEMSGGQTTYRSATDLGVPRTIQVVLSDGSCREARSGAWAPMTASVTLDGTTRQGCAWRGLLR